MGGAETLAVHLMAGMSRLHTVAAVSLFDGARPRLEKRLVDSGVHLWNLGKHPGFDPRMFGASDRVLREFRPDVVHTHLSVLRYVLPGLLRRGVPLAVHTLHNLAERETDVFGRVVNRFAFRKAVLPVAISREVAASFKRVYGIECKAVVPNCIPVEDFRSDPAERARWRACEGFSERDVLFVSVARLEPQKNPLLLIEAFASITDPRARLLLLGNGSLKQTVAALARERGVADRVCLAGERSDVASCLAAADVFVLASDWEGNPLAVMEAMAAGLPVISTAVGGVPELVHPGRHGILVPRRDAAALSGAMQRLLDDPCARAVMGHAARERACSQFCVERMVEGYDSLYAAALAEVSLQ
jgi:glycosyltransferase involved in cell wall biosynthesis